MLLAPNLKIRIEAERPTRPIRSLPDVNPGHLSQPLDVLFACGAAATVKPLIFTQCLASGVSVKMNYSLPYGQCLDLNVAGGACAPTVLPQRLEHGRNGIDGL